MKRTISLLLTLVMVITMLVGTASAEAAELTYAEGTVLRMATGYNNTKTGLFFDAGVAGEGVTLADGMTYLAGDLKPTWVEVEKQLGVKFENQYQGNSAAKEFDFWKDRLAEVDMVSGTAAKLTEYGEAGSIVNIADYLDMMPNFKAYLEANPIVRLSITGNTDTGAIYFSPYFDGVNDIERMPLMRVDWVYRTRTIYNPKGHAPHARGLGAEAAGRRGCLRCRCLQQAGCSRLHPLHAHRRHRRNRRGQPGRHRGGDHRQEL